MRIFSFFLCLFFTALLHAEIIEIKHFKEVDAYLQEESLVILDVDDTLLIPVQMLGCDEWFLSRLKTHRKEGKSESESLEKSLAEWEAVRHITQMEIVEAGTSEYVRNLQERGYKVMGLTTQGLALATRTQQHLNEQHIDLLKTAPSKEDYYLTIDGHGILFRSGLLSTSGAHKGKALFSLLSQLNMNPKHILFINDKASHLQSIEETAKEKGVAFTGLRYGYSDARKAAFEPELADLQFKYSTFTHLLSDSEARALQRQNIPNSG